jgi:LPXTG-motif cell wall-anchored protein
MEGGTPVQFLHGENTNERKENLMKNFKKVVALLIAAMMIVGTMNMSVLASSTSNGDTEIKVTGLAAGDTVNFYQILEWKADQGTYKGWSFMSPFNGAGLGFTGATADYDAIKAIVGDPAASPAVPMGITSELAGKLAVEAKTATAANTTPIKVTADEAALTIADDSELGLYIAIITPDPQSDNVYYPVFVSADFNKTNPSSLWNVTSAATYSNKSAAKKSTPGVIKEATRDDNTTYDLTWTSTRIGEVVHFKVTAVIPGYGQAMEHPKYYAKDKLTNLKLASVPTVTNLAGKYTIDPSGGKIGDDNYSISFNEDFLKTLTVPTTVEITYDAVVTTTAEKNINEELNEVWVEYNHDPQNEDDFNVHKDDTIHYTYSIDANILGGYGEQMLKSGKEVVKIGKNPDGSVITQEWEYSDVTPGNGYQGKLEGAQFKLYSAVPHVDPDKNGTTMGAEYQTVEGYTYDIWSKADGRLYTRVMNGNDLVRVDQGIQGLDAGIYYLVEENAPTGFIKDSNPVKIEIEPHFVNKQFTEYWLGGNNWTFTPTANAKSSTYDMDVLDWYQILINDVVTTKHTFWNDGTNKITYCNEGTRELPYSIVNTKGVELPSTGGMGTTLFYAIGAVLVLGAGILLVSKRRMSAY